MNDELRRQIITFGQFGFARPAAAQRTAFGKQSWACGAMYSAVHSSTAEQRRIGGINNRVNTLYGYIAPYEFYNCHTHSQHLYMRSVIMRLFC
jgi:hypothetical protein